MWLREIVPDDFPTSKEGDMLKTQFYLSSAICEPGSQNCWTDYINDVQVYVPLQQSGEIRYPAHRARV